MADRLKAAGYATGLVGKWHLGASRRIPPAEARLRRVLRVPRRGARLLRRTRAPHLPRHQPVKEKDYLTDAFGREAVAFIDRHKGNPFFLYLAFNAVHTPMQATDARLAGSPSIADKTPADLRRDDARHGRGHRQRCCDKLRETGLEEDTLIFFISDNGGPTMPGTTINGSRNAPLRGSKRTTLEGGIRVPFLVSWPGHLKAGVYEPTVIQLDALPPPWPPRERNRLEARRRRSPAVSERRRIRRTFATPVLWPRRADGDPAGDFKLVRYDSNADTRTGGQETARHRRETLQLGRRYRRNQRPRRRAGPTR